MGKILVLAEKPSAGRDYAQVLDAKAKKDGYLEGDDYIVSWAIGHLVTLKEPDEYKEEWKSWDLDLLPLIPERFETKVIKDVKKQFDILKTLINREDVDMIINGGDAGREGELIQRLILQMAGNTKPVKRLWVSSLTRDAIEEGFRNLKEGKEFDRLFAAAKLRSYADWLIGMNYTRGITKKYYKGKGVLSIGRCQTPILKLIVDRDLEIEDFKKIPYYEVQASFDNAYSGKYINKDTIVRFDKKEDAQNLVKSITGKDGVIKDVKVELKKAPAPLLHNLTSLGQVLNRKYGYSAQESLEILQGLYEKHKVVTYPRASAKVISKSVYQEMKKNISYLAFDKFKTPVSQMTFSENKRYVNDTKIEDHHAIIPDFKNPNMEAVYGHLTQKEKNVFDVLAQSIIAAFLPFYQYKSITVLTTVEDKDFISKGIEVVDRGWKTLVFDDSEKEEEDKVSSSLKKGATYKVSRVDLLEKETKPKQRYNEALLLSDMEKYGIGTEATRAGLIETLKKRTYIKVQGKTLLSTDHGRNLIEILPINDIQDIEYTSLLEKELEKVAEGKADPRIILQNIKEEVQKNIEEIKKGEGKVMSNLSESLGLCPACGKGYIMKSKSGHFYCNRFNDGCKFYVGEILGKKISETQVKKLLQNKKTDVIKGFVSQKSGKAFDAALIVTEDGKISFNFGTSGGKKEPNDNFKCPKCNKSLFITEKVAKCEDGHVLIFRTISGKKLSDAVLKELLTKGETKPLTGFISKSGKEFNAKLKLDSEGKTSFEFESRA